MWVKQMYNDQGEKAGKLLAWRFKKIQTDRAINSILLSSGENLVDPKYINDAFAKPVLSQSILKTYTNSVPR